MKPDSKDRLPWAQLFKRVFDENVLTCNKCGGLRRVEASSDAPPPPEALGVLGIPFEPLQLANARDPPPQRSFDLGSDDHGTEPIYPD